MSSLFKFHVIAFSKFIFREIQTLLLIQKLWICAEYFISEFWTQSYQSIERDILVLGINITPSVIFIELIEWLIELYEAFELKNVTIFPLEIKMEQ